MLSINQSLTGGSANAVGTYAQTLRSQHKQAWLQSLEQAGLSEALRQVRIMLAAKNMLPETQASVLQENARRADSRAVADGGDSWRLRPTTEAAQLTSEGVDVNSQGLLASMATDESHPLTSVGGVVVLDNNTELFDQASSSVLTRSASSVSLALETLSYPSQNVLMLNTGAGVEVWIRDVSLSRSRLVDLLKGIRLSMGVLGASLARVVLNGQDVFVLSSQPSGKTDSPRTEV